ncbi:MAG: ABC transporter permease, partial [Candidatus Heimdallarchaeota archaeon]|nr:ABC transporter permease [Candidatus Heimdallarchaeota archaeon]
MFGFPFSTRIIFAFIFVIFLSLAMSGIGIILASLAQDQNTVAGLANMIATPMAFLASAFFPMPNPTIITSFIGGRTLGIFDLL